MHDTLCPVAQHAAGQGPAMCVPLGQVVPHTGNHVPWRPCEQSHAASAMLAHVAPGVHIDDGNGL